MASRRILRLRCDDSNDSGDRVFVRLADEGAELDVLVNCAWGASVDEHDGCWCPGGVGGQCACRAGDESPRQLRTS